jgi:hypothetical protein
VIEANVRGQGGELKQKWLVIPMQDNDFNGLIKMNRKRGLAHPMFVDVDLKEGYPHGWA